jgi:hypothetical protein
MKNDLLLLVEEVEVSADRRKEWSDAIAVYFTAGQSTK